MLIWKLSVLHSNVQRKNTVAKIFLDKPGEIPYPGEFSRNYLCRQLIWSDIVLEGTSKVNNVSLTVPRNSAGFSMSLLGHSVVSFCFLMESHDICCFLFFFSWSPRFWGHISYLIFKNEQVYSSCGTSETLDDLTRVHPMVSETQS